MTETTKKTKAKTKTKKTRDYQLTSRQLKLAKGLASGLKLGIAAVAAGYPKKSATAAACRDVKKPRVKKAIVEEVDKAAKKAGINPEWVYKKLKALHDFNSKVVHDDDGAEFMIDASVALQSVQTVGKFLRMGEKREDAKDDALKTLAETLRERLKNEG